jgi:hypothetical protein
MNILKGAATPSGVVGQTGVAVGGTVGVRVGVRVAVLVGGAGGAGKQPVKR